MPIHRSNGQPSEPTDVVALCQRYLGVEPQLVAQYDRLHVQLQRRVQSRIDVNNAPDYMVQRYARLMSETRFPPPLYTEDGVPIDGNTRTRAYIERNVRYIEAYVLPIKALDADPMITRKLKLLSLALNAKNGLALDEAELVNYATELILDGVSDEEIVGQTGVKLSKVTSLRDRNRAADRLTTLGLNVEGLKMPETVLRAFGKPNAMRLDDDFYKAIVGLTKDAGITKAGAVSAMATAIHEAPTPETKQERLARERKALEPQILARENDQLHLPLTDWWRKAMDKILAHQVTSFIETNPEKAAEYVEKIDKVLDKIAEIRELQLSQPAIGAAQAAAQPTASPIP